MRRGVALVTRHPRFDPASALTVNGQLFRPSAPIGDLTHRLSGSGAPEWERLAREALAMMQAGD